MIRQVDVSEADQQSAQTFFDALFRVYDLEKALVLDAFARNGQLTVRNYVQYLRNPYKQLTLWELQPEHQEALREFSLQVKIGDSYQLITQETSPFDLLIVDTPQGLHQDSNNVVHAEHWDFVKLAMPRLAPGAVVVLYVNKQPYDAKAVGHHGYDTYSEYDYVDWMCRRQALYGFATNPHEEAYLWKYRRLFREHGREIQSSVVIPCHSDVEGLRPYSFRLGVQLD